VSRPGAASNRNPGVPRSEAAPDWVGAAESEGFPYYLAVLRSHVRLILITVAVSVCAAALYLIVADKVYQSHADVLVTPLPRDDPTFVGLALTTDSSDPTRDVETVARLIKTPVVAGRVVSELGLHVTPRQLLADVDATPVASSNVVTITAKANDPKRAAQIANAFGTAGIDYRTRRLHEQLDVIIPQLQKQVAQLPEGTTRAALVGRVRNLEVLRSLQDPTLHLATRAVPSGSAVSPRPLLSVAAALLAGLIVGGAAALGSELFDRRLRREEQLGRYRIPILARIPLQRSEPRGTDNPARLSASLLSSPEDSYFLVGARLANQAGEGTKRSVFVTGPGRGNGTTTTALSLAAAISRSEGVVLIEADSRTPTLAGVLGATPKYGISDVVAGRVSIRDAFVGLDSEPNGLLLLAEPTRQTSGSMVMAPGSADELIREAEALTDWVVIDAPPLTIVPDALPLATRADDVLLVARLGNTRLKMLEELAELLVQQGVTPAGFVLVGVRQSAASVPSRLKTAATQSQAVPWVRSRMTSARSAVSASASLLQQPRSSQTKPTTRAPKRDLARQNQDGSESEEPKRHSQERLTD